MNTNEIDRLVRRLVLDPHDEDAVAYAYQVGQEDPKGYALLLESVGHETRDPIYACHWLSQAADVWVASVGDAHRAARVLMEAIDRDPTQRQPADRLGQLYREKGDVRALLALLERRVKALTPLAPNDPNVQRELALVHEELGRVWAESLEQPKKALEHFRKSVELDPSGAFAIYSAREILKRLGQIQEALALYEPELAITEDPARRIALLREEAEARRSTGDLAGAQRALARARKLDEGDPTLQVEYASILLDRVHRGEELSAQERAHGAELLVALAEIYDGEHGIAYAGGALDLDPAHERALRLFVHHTQARRGAPSPASSGDDNALDETVRARYIAYLAAAPEGAMAAEARKALGTDQKSASESWLEAVRRSPGDEHAIGTASRLLESEGKVAEAVALLAEHAPLVVSPTARGALLERLGDLRDRLGDSKGAGDAYTGAADTLRDVRLWELAEHSYVDASSWKGAAFAAEQRAALAHPAKEKAPHLARAADYLARAGDDAGATRLLEQAVEADPSDEDYAKRLAARYTASEKWESLASFLAQRADRVTDATQRASLRREAATIYAERLGDVERSRALWLKVLDDGHDHRAIEKLANDALSRGGSNEGAKPAENRESEARPDQEHHWNKVADWLADRIEKEKNEQELSILTRKLAQVLAERLDRGDEALAVLTELADAGDVACRAAYIDIGDRLGWFGVVAMKLVEWWRDAPFGAERARGLWEAFERFTRSGREREAAQVAIELARDGGVSPSLAARLQDWQKNAKDPDAQAIVRELLASTHRS